ncbi:MAG: hypothetical protein ABIX01_02750 [Chitinophagaceae bacterium]
MAGFINATVTNFEKVGNRFQTIRNLTGRHPIRGLGGHPNPRPDSTSDWGFPLRPAIAGFINATVTNFEKVGNRSQTIRNLTAGHPSPTGEGPEMRPPSAQFRNVA